MRDCGCLLEGHATFMGLPFRYVGFGGNRQHISLESAGKRIIAPKRRRRDVGVGPDCQVPAMRHLCARTYIIVHVYSQRHHHLSKASRRRRQPPSTPTHEIPSIIRFDGQSF